MNEQFDEEILSDVIAAILAAFPLRFNINKDAIDFKDLLVDLSHNDLHLASHALMDIHEVLELELDYMPLTEFEQFDTVSSITEYFYNELVKKKSNQK